jgi:hypothetical protein
LTKIKDERTPIGFDSAADRLRNNVMRSIHCWLAAGWLLFPLYTFTAAAQQVTGVPGSPGATITIDGKQLPPPDPPFGGVIKEKASESKPYCGARRSWLSTTRP